MKFIASSMFSIAGSIFEGIDPAFETIWFLEKLFKASSIRLVPGVKGLLLF